MTAWLLILASYLLGAVPTSYVGGRLSRGIDLRGWGSGNLGATNTFRVLGWRVALPVLIVDVLKGWAPVFYFPRLDGLSSPDWALAYGAAAVIGHVFSLYVRFKGGKGVATSGGVLLALAPVATLVGFGAWLLVVLWTRIVSLASLVAAVIIPFVVYLTQGRSTVFWLAVGLALFVLVAHRSNVRRLLRGEEHRFRRQTEEVR